MGIKMAITQVTQVDDGLWKVQLPPHQVRHFGSVNSSTGVRSIILVEDAVFQEATSTLECDLENISPLNVGTSDEAFIVSSGQIPNLGETPHTPLTMGKGDEEFLQMCRSSLSSDMYETAKDLLLSVRARSSGNLKRGQKRNFSETPDNFWYVIVQPRIDQLQITVRGSLDHFSGVSKLEIKDDRGNTRFKIRSKEDMTEALKLIFHAVKKYP